MRVREPLRAFVLALLLAACASSPKINVGDNPDGSVAGSGGASGAAGLGGFGGGDNALTAAITEPPSEMAIEVITIACAGECKSVLAVASGGNAPYAFTWNDGVAGNSREICGIDDTTFAVTVNDTPVIGDEFTYEGQQVSASVTVQVLSCPDDGGVHGDLCILNASFEGVPGANGSASATPPGTPGLPQDVVFDAPPWQECTKSPDIWDENASWGAVPSGLAATEGATYLSIYNVLGLRESVGEALCTPLVAGHTYSFEVDFAFRTEGSFVGAVAGAFEMWAGNVACGQGQLLFTSPVATTVWQTACVTFTAENDYSFLMVGAAPGSGITGAFVDNIVPVDSCP